MLCDLYMLYDCGHYLCSTLIYLLHIEINYMHNIYILILSFKLLHIEINYIHNMYIGPIVAKKTYSVWCSLQWFIIQLHSWYWVIQYYLILLYYHENVCMTIVICIL